MDKPKRSRIQKKKRQDEGLGQRTSITTTDEHVSLYVGWLTVRAASGSHPSREEAAGNEQDHGGHTKDSRRGRVPPEDQQSLGF